ncbi:MAG: NAD-binding protein [Treponema sp.]|nr:NAD-binding protein [Treponema sp.]MBQ2552540.1 NAD-binding protein [Treponema sp.]MBQ4236296.1 NAD-binding protein [Treponema sp.]MBQ5382878.1 NAD-binding protein [Treponema sp.]
MKIVIVGAGFTGTQLAKRLLNDAANNVILIDNNSENVNSLRDTLDCTITYADGNDLQTLEEAGISTADALVAVTEDDEVNMITCSLVDSIYPDVLKIARVRNYAYYMNTNKTIAHHAETFKKNHRPLYGIDYMINPDVEAAEAIVNAVEHGVSDVMPLGDGSYELTTIKINPGSKIEGCALKDMRKLTDKPVIVTFVEKKDSSSLPAGDTILYAGDSIGVLTHRDNLDEIRKMCGEEESKIKKTILVGIGRIGTIVAEMLLGNNATQKKIPMLAKILGKKKKTKKTFQRFLIVDSDKEHCDAAVNRFPDADIFQEDITDENFIYEEELDKFDLCICATHNHELNLVVSSYFEALGVKNTVALITNSAFSPIAEKMGVDVAVPIRDTVVDSIMSHLRGENVKEVHTVSTGEFEIIECDVPQKSKVLGKTLKEIAKPGKFLMLLIQKPGTTGFELVNGNTTLNVGDHVILIQESGSKETLELISGKE